MKIFSNRITKCRYCGRDIIWKDMKSGKRMPCDPEVICFIIPEDGKGSEKFVTQNGEVASGDRVYGGEGTLLGYISHFATCGKRRKK